ncbi:MAG TPA: hypothetical protein VGM43_09755 [Bryobacteraceae bacterium]|jgi:DUF4097 and DUF4098 domain-containing protein YvlB
MKQILFMALMGATLAFTAAGRDYKVEDRSPVNHTFSSEKKLDVDVISGSVEIIADGGNSIRVTGERVIHAADQQQLAKAKQDDVLDMNEKDGTAQIYENGPFRNNNNSRSSDNHGFHENSDRREYNVDWNLTVHVPREIALRLRDVNGSIKADGTNGAFDIGAVNGSVTGTNIGGSGNISTVNGPTVISFRDNPKSDSSFKSVNGKVDVTYQPNLAAEFDLKTVNGGMFTDFESVALASTGGGSSKDGKFVYKSHGNSRIRIGSGGPEIRMETVNGPIQIRKAK